jgi:hypothetical protein
MKRWHNHFLSLNELKNFARYFEFTNFSYFKINCSLKLFIGTKTHLMKFNYTCATRKEKASILVQIWFGMVCTSHIWFLFVPDGYFGKTHIKWILWLQRNRREKTISRLNLPGLFSELELLS